MPTLSTLIDKFLTRSTMTDTDKEDLRGDINAVGTAIEITTALQGVAAVATKIGEEYLPEALAIDSFTLGNTSVDTLPVGSVGGTGNYGELAWHNNSDEGGIKYQMQRNVINGLAIATAAEIVAGTTHKEVGRFRLEPSEVAAGLGGWYLLTGEIIVYSKTDASLTTAPYIGLHLSGSSQTTVIRGIYTQVTAGASGYINTVYKLSIPVLLYDMTGGLFQIRADETKIGYHALTMKYNEGSLSGQMFTTFSEQTSSLNSAPVASPAEIILSLRVGQDATFTGDVTMVANNCVLKPLA